MDTFQARLRHLKQRDRIIAKEIARACGVSVQAVFGWLSGTSMPKPQNVVALAKMFGVSSDHLINGDADSVRAESLDLIRAALPTLSNDKLELLAKVAVEFSKST
jgi:transcriptional regulator with XRE-family HTH domain